MIFPAKFNVTTLNGLNGFMFISDSGDYWYGMKTANLGDINNDTKPDLLVSALSNQAYVLFGAQHFPSRVYTSSLSGTNGFIVVAEKQTLEFQCVAGVGDVNVDGIDDFILGVHGVPEIFVIFGANSFPPRVSLANLNGKTGFKIIGVSTACYTADGIGDINNDSKSDFIISNSEQQLNSAGAFVIYGSEDFPAILNLSQLDGKNGFAIISERVYGGGAVVAAGLGDFNGDSKPDFVIGIILDPDNAYYIIFGADKFPPVLYTSNLTGTNGFTIIGVPLSNIVSISKINDINGDCLPDLSVSSEADSSNVVIFGAPSFNSTFDVSKLDGSNGFKVVGPFFGSGFGFATSNIGSLNHNNKSGLIIGAPQTGLNGKTGSAYVFFGSDHFPSEIHTSGLNGANGFEIVGLLNANLGYSVAGIDNFAGDGKSTMVVGAVLENTVYVILDPSIV